MLFLIILAIIILIFLVPLCISDERLHQFSIKYGLVPRANIDVIQDEINNNNNLIQKHNSYYRSGRNHTDVYIFVKPVSIEFNVESDSIYYYSLFKTYNNVDTLSVLTVGDDIECIISHGENTESVYIFDGVHQLDFKIIY